MLKQIFKWFGNGLLFLFPIGVTVIVLVKIFVFVDSLVRRPLEELMGRSIAMGFGVLITIAVILIVGMIISLLVTKPLVRLIDNLFGRMPLVKLLYNSLKDLIGAFVGEKKKFDKPVVVELIAGSGVKALGFITRDSLAFFGMAKEVAVYFPQSYNFAGFLLIVPQQQIQPLTADSSDVMAFIVSGGVSGASKTKPLALTPDAS